MRTRELLVEAAAKVFDENGFAGASVNKILSYAGVTAGGMYFHFKSKEELARAVILEQASRLTLPDEPRGLQQMIDLSMYLTQQLDRDVLFRAGVRLAVEQGESGIRDYTVYDWWSSIFVGELRAARANGELRPEVDELAFARMFVASYTGNQVMSDIATSRRDLAERVVSMWHFLLPGIAAPGHYKSLSVDFARAAQIGG